MSAPGGGGAIATERSSARRARLRWVWMAMGLGLMALAVWVGLRTGAVPRAFEALQQARALVVAALLVLPVVSWLLTSTLFWALTRRFGRVGWGEMSALIGAAWLLNNLPMRPGMVGRITYHRVVNGIPVRASVRVLIESLLCTGLAALLGVAILAVATGHALIGLGVGAGMVIAAAVALGALRQVGRALPLALLAIGVAFRLADLATWWARYWLLLHLTGVSMTPLEVMVVTLASQVASMTPVQFGLREWAVGGVASLTGGSVGGGALLSAGLAADLLNRGIELMLVIPIGLTCAWWVARGIRRGRAGAQERGGRES